MSATSSSQSGPASRKRRRGAFVGFTLLLAVVVVGSLVWDRCDGCASAQGPNGQALAARGGYLPADGMSIDESSRTQFGPLFSDFFVVRDGATDCAFVASLMLVLRHDAEYPFRVLHGTATGYVVRFPGLRTSVFVTTEALNQHRRNWEKTRPAYRRIWPGHIPRGLEILRCAYYDYQARAGIRGEVGSVHDGGLPARDLLVLTGAERSTSVLVNCPEGDGTFASCRAARTVTVINDDGTFSTTRLGSADVTDALETAGGVAGRLLVASSSNRVPRFGSPRLLSNHAYYYLGRTEGGLYLLGDSYRTRCPVAMTLDQFKRCFRAVDYVDLRPAPVPRLP